MISAPIRICIVDDDALFRESLAVALSLQKDFQVVGHYEGVADVRPLLSKAAPDILLLETLLPDRSGLELLREMPTLSPNSKAIMTANLEVESDVVEAMRLGARGFLVKHCPPDLFFKCIRKAHSGEIWLNGQLTEAVLVAFGAQRPATQPESKNDLSRRELEVVQLVIQGYKNRDIAQKLFISEKTVKNHLSAVFNKLGVADRLEMTLYVFEKRLFSPDSF